MQQKSMEMQNVLEVMGVPNFTFSQRPVIERKMWETLQSMHRHTLAMSLVMDVSAVAVSDWVTVIDIILDTEAPWGSKHFVEALMLHADSLSSDRVRRLPAHNVRTVLMPQQQWFAYFDPENNKSLTELMDIMHGRVPARGADGEMCPATDYHSKFLRMCYSGDMESFNHPDDYNIDSLCDSIKIYQYLTVLPEKWMCSGTGKAYSLS
jgi:hypothetical protein